MDPVIPEKPLRILVTGGRDYPDYFKVREVLDRLTYDEGEMLPRAGTTIIHGGATGADSHADQWATVCWVSNKEYPAKWDDLNAPGAVIRHGKRGPYNLLAGFARNQQMLDEGKPDLVVAFPTPGAANKGTHDMIRRAKAAGVPVLVVE